jgi:predicted nucleic acid-binding protein
MASPKGGVPRVLFDSDFLLTLLDDKDRWHEASLEAFRKLQAREHIQIVPDCVVNEVVSMIARKYGGTKNEADFHRILHRLEVKIPSAKILWTYPKVPELYEPILKVMAKYGGRLNFHDALLVIVMLKGSIEYIVSKDEDFDEVKGIKRIDPAQVETTFLGPRPKYDL